MAGTMDMEAAGIRNLLDRVYQFYKLEEKQA